MRRGRVLIVLVAIAALLAAGCTGADGPDDLGTEVGFVSGNGAVTILQPEQRAEPTQLRGDLLDGSEFDLADTRGDVVLINVWGSWCAPCRKEAPALQAAWEQLQGLGDVRFLGLNTRDDAAGAAEAFERRFGITYPSLRDPDGRLQLLFRSTLPPRAIPSTLVLDRQGRVAARILGESTRGTFVGLVEQIRDED